MKINDENIIPPRIKQIIEHCDELREYYEDMYFYAGDDHHACSANAYADILNMFEQLGIIEEEPEDGRKLEN